MYTWNEVHKMRHITVQMKVGPVLKFSIKFKGVEQNSEKFFLKIKT